jgi:lipid A oxidase
MDTQRHLTKGAVVMRGLWFGFATMIATASAAAAQAELSFYGGIQDVRASTVSGTDPSGGAFNFSADWEGRSLVVPRYFGVRLTWWRTDDFGWGLDFSRNKAYASDQTLADNGLAALEFSDGLNLLTLNAYRRWKNSISHLTPYVGAGVGISIPHVEFDSGAGRTAEYQIGGPAVLVVAGASYPLNDRWSVFGEYKGSYSVNNVELVNGGSLSTDIRTSALNLGVSLGF